MVLIRTWKSEIIMLLSNATVEVSRRYCGITRSINHYTQAQMTQKTFQVNNVKTDLKTVWKFAPDNGKIKMEPV